MLVQHAWQRLQRDGIGSTLAYGRFWLYEKVHERYYGVTTRKQARPAAHGYGEHYHEHEPTPYRALKRIFASLSFEHGAKEVLVDYGSGAGRVVLFAAMVHPFRSVIGVELLPAMVELAERNRDRLRPRLLCSDVRFVAADAIDYQLPNEATIAFFFNPLRADMLRRVLDNIRATLLASPRRFTLVFFSPALSQPAIDQCPWMSRVAVFRASPSVCHVYRVDPG